MWGVIDVITVRTIGRFIEKEGETTKSRMDPMVQAAGMKVGIDATSLYEKYKNRAMSPLNINHSTYSPAQTLEGSTTVRSESSILDAIVVCQRCHGTGLYKVRYNHQVREVNCSTCDAGGLLVKEEGNAGAASHPLRPFKVSSTRTARDAGMESVNDEEESPPMPI